MKIIKAKKINNRLEMADYGLHRIILTKILGLNLSKKSRILILGCGQGGMDKLLLERGLKNITAIDINPKNYKIKGARFIKWDLNKDFNWGHEKYDLILAVEIIEHLYSTHHFVKETRKKLSKNGVLILTTPNILEKTSKVNLILRNRFSSFNERALKGWGHMNPIFPHIFKYYIEINNLKIIEENYSRKAFDQIIIRSWKTYIYHFIMFFLSNFLRLISSNKENIEGVINIYIVEKKD